MRYTIATQLIGHDLPGFTAMTSQSRSEEAFCGSSISLGLQKHIDHFTIPKALATLMGQALLIHGSPQIMLFTIYFDENFIDVESIAIASVLSFQSTCIDGTELYTDPAP
jgi:hypothetical protein